MQDFAGDSEGVGGSERGCVIELRYSDNSCI
jgi:hypothetical protein